MTPQKTSSYRPTPTNPNVPADTESSTRRDASDDTDAVLDDIDAVLEENALEVLQAYVQRGGQAVAVFLDTVARGFEAITWKWV